MSHPAVPTAGDVKSPEWLLKLAHKTNELLKGRLNVSTTLTLTANAASTTLTDDRLAVDSVVVLVPTTANAAAEIGNGTLYIPETGRVNGSVVITHANNAQTDRTFRVLIMG